jgi:hypothetical protein
MARSQTPQPQTTADAVREFYKKLDFEPDQNYLFERMFLHGPVSTPALKTTKKS